MVYIRIYLVAFSQQQPFEENISRKYVNVYVARAPMRIFSKNVVRSYWLRVYGGCKHTRRREKVSCCIHNFPFYVLGARLMRVWGIFINIFVFFAAAVFFSFFAASYMLNNINTYNICFSRRTKTCVCVYVFCGVLLLILKKQEDAKPYSMYI